MENIKMVLIIAAFTSAIGSAFATKPYAQRDIRIVDTGVCRLIPCSSIDRNFGYCTIIGTKYHDANCVTIFSGQTFTVANP